MTSIRNNSLNGVIDCVDKGLSLIDSLYAIIYMNNEDRGKVLFASLSKSTRLLRIAHQSLCVSIGDGNGLNPEKANVTSVTSGFESIKRQMDLVKASVFAAVNNPFLYDSRQVRQEQP